MSKKVRVGGSVEVRKYEWVGVWGAHLRQDQRTVARLSVIKFVTELTAGVKEGGG